MKKIIVLLLIACTTQMFSQDVKALKASALRDAKAACKATLDEDFKTLLTFTHPNIINAAGGVEIMEEFLESTFNQMKASGFKYEIAEAKSVSDIVKEQNEYRCYVENYNVMSMNDKRIISTSYMVGFYNETTKKWTFVEAKELKSSGTIATYFPDFKTSMEIPENTMEMKDIKKE
jgi:ketosteroid isomerase-like protein